MMWKFPLIRQVLKPAPDFMAIKFQTYDSLCFVHILQVCLLQCPPWKASHEFLPGLSGLGNFANCLGLLLSIVNNIILKKILFFLCIMQHSNLRTLEFIFEWLIKNIDGTLFWKLLCLTRLTTIQWSCRLGDAFHIILRIVQSSTRTIHGPIL